MINCVKQNIRNKNLDINLKISLFKSSNFMSIETRIFKNIKKSFFFLEKKIYFFKKTFSISILFLFIGFFLGNIFGTFLNWLRHFIVWDGLLIFALLFFFEIISSIVYQNNLTFASQPVLTNKMFFSHFFVIKNLFLKINLLRRKLKATISPRGSATIAEGTDFLIEPTDQPILQTDNKKSKKFLTTNFYFFKSLPIWRFLNCLKVGILFGFFIDAFKVGS